MRLIPNLIDKNSTQYNSRQIKLQAKQNFWSKSASNNGFGKNVNSKSRNPGGASGGGKGGGNGGGNGSGSKENNKTKKETEKPKAKLTNEEYQQQKEARKSEENKKKREMQKKKGRRIGDIIHCNNCFNIIKKHNVFLYFSDKIGEDIDKKNPDKIRQFYLNLGYPEWDLGPSGKPKLHFKKFPTKKQAENFAKKHFKG